MPKSTEKVLAPQVRYETKSLKYIFVQILFFLTTNVGENRLVLLASLASQPSPAIKRGVVDGVGLRKHIEMNMSLINQLCKRYRKKKYDKEKEKGKKKKDFILFYLFLLIKCYATLFFFLKKKDKKNVIY
jgi:hypothetical protein